jgi:hypothetical protein
MYRDQEWRPAKSCSVITMNMTVLLTWSLYTEEQLVKKLNLVPPPSIEDDKNLASS